MHRTGAENKFWDFSFTELFIQIFGQKTWREETDKYTLENIIKMDLKEMGCEDVDWIQQT